MAQPLTPVDDVVADLLSRVTPTSHTVKRPLDQALGHYLATDTVSGISVPPAANSAMDGYAVNCIDIAAGADYEVSQRIPAGKVGGVLKPGTIARIFTGAPMPEGADSVVIQEDTEAVGERVRISIAPVQGENVRPAGQDIAIGTTILRKGRLLRPQDLGLLASSGFAQVEVFEPLKISIMSTGDELVEPPGQLQPGEIYNSNRYALSGLLTNLGMEVIDLGVVKDTPAATESALLKGASVSDCILSTGGVSVGEEDHVRAALERLGSLEIWRIAIKPGKPLAFGRVGGTPFFGLPGNPVSTFVTFMLIARPYLVAFQGGEGEPLPWFWGEADFSHAAGGRREYLRVCAQPDDGINRLSKFVEQGSGVMSSLSWANALAEVELGQAVEPGDRLKYYLF